MTAPAQRPASNSEGRKRAQEKADIAALVERSSLGTPEAQALRASVSDEQAARVVARAEELRSTERVIEKADGLSRTEPYADPDLSPEYDEDGEPIPGTLGVGWDVSFGCRINFGPNPDGDLRVSVHVSDQAKRAGLAVSPTTPAQLRALAAHLTAVADDQGPTPAEPDADERCECPPCPGRGNDGHGMTHCAECCFGQGVEADELCPTHGRLSRTPDAHLAAAKADRGPDALLEHETQKLRISEAYWKGREDRAVKALEEAADELAKLDAIGQTRRDLIADADWDWFVGHPMRAIAPHRTSEVARAASSWLNARAARLREQSGGRDRG